MCATWLLLGTGVYDAILLQSSEKRGVEYVCLPYNISLQAKQDQKIIQLNTQIAESSRYFKHIPAQSEKMREAVELAQLIAPRNVPVIIQGATGTGRATEPGCGSGACEPAWPWDGYPGPTHRAVRAAGPSTGAHHAGAWRLGSVGDQGGAQRHRPAVG